MLVSFKGKNLIPFFCFQLPIQLCFGCYFLGLNLICPGVAGKKVKGVHFRNWNDFTNGNRKHNWTANDVGRAVTVWVANCLPGLKTSFPMAIIFD